MRALLPAFDAGPIDLHSWYGRDWLETGGLRVNFIAAVDGAVTVTGASRGLQTPGDNHVFAALRDLADVILVGAGTARAERYAGIRLSDRRRTLRVEHGLQAELPTAVVSRALRLDPADPLFTGAEPDARTIVLTSADADAEVRASLSRVADVVECGEHTVEPALARGALERRGLDRILCEGGPTLFADLAAGGVVDELCLTTSPMLGGPGAGRITGGPPWTGAPVGLGLADLLEEDGALFARYRVIA
jgi:riboflavin biosynthesis pyrimidine reductase